MKNNKIKKKMKDDRKDYEDNNKNNNNLKSESKYIINSLIIFCSIFILSAISIIFIINNKSYITYDENYSKSEGYEDNKKLMKLSSLSENNSNNKYELKKIKNRENKFINLNLEARETKILFDGKFLKSYSYNGLSPGPIIRGKVGDILNVTLINNLNEDTTIHWHGLQVPNNMDGVPGVTQEPVKPGESFNYKFKLNEAGIYWYHSHVNTAEQVGRGLYGILIVELNNDSVKYDEEKLLILDDIRLNNNGEIAPFGSMMDTHMAGRYGNNYFINGNINVTLNSKVGSLLNLKIVNTANARIFKFGIEKHKFIVLGNDIGRIEKPYETDSLILAPGERAEIIVYLNKTKQNKFNLLNLAARNPEIIGVLNYEFNNLTHTNSKNNSTNDIKDYKNSKEFDKNKYYEKLIKENLEVNLPDWSDKIDLEPDVIFDLYAINGEDGFKWTINGGYYPKTTDIQDLEEGKFYKLRYTSKQNMIHPMHLHGQKFIILAKNGIPVNDTMYRDTALVFPGESVDVGLIAQGKGSWVNHCHILEHADAGMLGIVNVD